ncbi:MAG TPA: hypothetical protein VHI54_01235 [Actinomycetota bacterium]|nr:hypothetical protein [Actinomycetota bacterium]
MSDWFVLVTIKAPLVAAVLMVFGYLLADAVSGNRNLDVLSRWALCLPALVTYAFLLMLAHMASGGRVFSNPWLVRIVTALVALGLVARKFTTARRPASLPKREVLVASFVLLVAMVMWGAPVLRSVPLAPVGSDSGWHMGWANQLMNGEVVPSSILSGNVPNYYPWMFHAVAALTAAFTPGGRPFHALGPLQLMQVAAAVLLLFTIGRMVKSGWITGVTTAFFGSLAAGLSFALISRFDSVLATPRSGGPRGTYNAVYNNLAPPLPRDLGYTLLLAFVLLALYGLLERSPVALIAGGVVLGLAGLTSAEFFFVGLGTALLLTAFSREMPRLAVAGAFFVPALSLFSLWLVPLVVNYARLGGFVNTTAVRATVLSSASILLSWGLATPFALYAALRWLPVNAAQPEGRVLLVFLVSAGVLVLASSAIPRLLGAGFAVVGRASRYWPVLHLAVALLAGVGAAQLFDRLVEWRPLAAVGVAAVLAGLALPLPLDVSLENAASAPGASPLRSALLGRSRNFLTDVASAGRRHCTVAAPGSVPLQVFAYTGYRHVAYVGSGRHRGNYARIRWRDIYGRITRESDRLADNRVLTEGRGDPSAWRRLAFKYRLNFVVVAREKLEAFRELFPGQVARLSQGREPFVALSVAACA